jgi:hypothetical protein
MSVYIGEPLWHSGKVINEKLNENQKNPGSLPSPVNLSKLVVV